MNTQPKDLHPALYDLDCYSVGKCPPVLEADISLHLKTCLECQNYLSELKQSHVAFLQKQPTDRLIQTLRLRKSQTWFNLFNDWFALSNQRLIWATAVVLLITGSIFILRPFSNDNKLEKSAGVRLMGQKQIENSLFRLFLRQGTVIQEISQSPTVKAGDALQINFTVTKPQYVAVFFLDESATINWVIPTTATNHAFLINNDDMLPRHSMVFDQSKTTERLFVIIRDQIFSPIDLSQKIINSWRTSPHKNFNTDDWIPHEPGWWSMVIYKQP